MISVIVALRRGETFKKTFHGEGEVILEAGGTVAEARNRGAQRARGDPLLFLDADMDLGGLDISTLNGGGLATCWYDTPHVGDWLNVTVQNLLAGVRSPFGFIGGFMLVKRRVFDALGGFRNVPYEDIDFASRAWWRGYRLHVLPVRAVHTRPFSHRDLFKPIPLGWGV